MLRYRTSFILITIFISVTIQSCVSFKKSCTLDPITGYFPTKNKNSALVLKRTKVNADTLKQLLLIPDDRYILELAQNMKYFNKVMTYSELEKEILEKKLTDKVHNNSGDLLLDYLYRIYHPYVILNYEFMKKNGAMHYTGITLYHPLKKEYIFENQISMNSIWQSCYHKEVINTAFNSLLDYLKTQQ